MTPEERITELGLKLPEAPPAVGAYVPWAQTGNLVVTSFQLPWRGGELAYTGKLGGELTTADGYEAARVCALHGARQRGNPRRDHSSPARVVRGEGRGARGRGELHRPGVRTA